MKKAIKDNYREVSGHMFDPKNTRGVTTVLDQESGGGARPRSSKKTIAKEGDEKFMAAVEANNKKEAE